MKLFATGWDADTDTPLYTVRDETAFVDAFVHAYELRIDELRSQQALAARGAQFSTELQRRPLADRGDPRAVGWTYLVAKDDPDRDVIAEILAPLARHRGMAAPLAPLLYERDLPWWEWLDEHYFATTLEDRTPPHYVLIVADPARVPFEFQTMLDSPAAVGRVAFDDARHLHNYVKKVIDLETSRAPVTRRAALCWAPDGGPDDATHYSHLYMAKPLASYLRTLRFDVHELFGGLATKAALLSAAASGCPAIVYTASHGLGPPSGSMDKKRRFAGALCGQRQPDTSSAEWLITADDLPESEPFLEGSVFFQFACFGYGVPATGDGAVWLEDRPGPVEALASEDFVSAIPRRLLANPRGPLAFIGHVDTAWLHGFADPDGVDVIERWHPRIAPFKRALELLAGVQPAGLAMADFNKQLDIGNSMVLNDLERALRNPARQTPESRRRLVDHIIRRNDAKNYMVFGDPAARLRIPLTT